MDRREPEGIELIQALLAEGSARRGPPLRTDGRARSAGLVLLLCVVAVGAPPPAAAQEGAAFAAVGTAALGAYSGATLGLLGGLVPCSTTLRGLACSRVAAGVGGVIGGISGAVIGSADRDFAKRYVRNAGIGAFIGVGTGLVLQELVRQYGWLDAGAGALIGGAIGAAPKGAGIGGGIGAAVGISLWAIFPMVEPGDAVALTLLGVAVGGLTQWITDAAEAGSSPTGPVPIPLFSIGVP
jgi:hypothetical protein